MDLKWLLVRRITLVAVLCLIAGAALALYETAREARQKNVAFAELVGRILDLQLSRIDRSTDSPDRFPDWSVIAEHALEPGQCVEFLGVNKGVRRSSCAGTVAKPPPSWFLALHDALVNDRLSATRTIVYRSTNRGAVRVSSNATATASAAWATIAPLIGFAALLVTALCIVTFWIVARALSPTKTILSGLNRLARGDLSYRLPRFRLAELNRISEVFNTLAADLKTSTEEKTELARRLVDAQEKERRHIARELHDDIAQKLAGLSAFAASIGKSAETDAPGLEKELRELSGMASGLMTSLRRTLAYLRPQEIDDLGLIQSLKALIDRHNKDANGRTSYSIETTGDVENLRTETSAHVYRIVQEALTNASRHANARSVKVHLCQQAETDQDKIRLTVADDGTGPPPLDHSRTAPSGSGLIGMRERVAALNGTFAFGPRPAGGFGLEVKFPIVQRGA